MAKRQASAREGDEDQEDASKRTRVDGQEAIFVEIPEIDEEEYEARVRERVIRSLEARKNTEGVCDSSCLFPGCY